MSETETANNQRSRRKTREGRVVSDKMVKTIVVRVNRRIAHPLYKKIITRFEKFHVHDEQDQARVGDVVRIMETRPLSKTKRWRLLEIVRHGELSTVKTQQEAPMAVAEA